MAKILIVEDDKFLANAYRVKLGKSGFDITMAYDGVQAIDALKTNTYELVILDLVMPNKDGFSVLEDMKQNPQFASIPVVVASNLGQREDIDRCAMLGATDYIIKSDLSLDELVIKIREILSQQQS